MLCVGCEEIVEADSDGGTETEEEIAVETGAAVSDEVSRLEDTEEARLLDEWELSVDALGPDEGSEAVE